MNPSDTPGLRRQLGLGAAVSLVISQVIAVGIFLTPAEMARSVGSPFWLLVIWVTMGVMAFCGALCYGELAARYPEAGGGYVYLREAFGPGTAFLYGWKCLLVMDPGLTAAFGMGLASYAGFITGLPAGGQKLLAIGAIATLALVNILGLRFGARVIGTLTVAKLGLLAVVIVAGFLSGQGDWAHFTPFVAQRAGSLPLAAALAAGMVSAFFSFAGWWDTAKLAGEVKDPGRVVPKALGLGVLVVTVVYLLTSAVFLYLVPLEQVTSGEAFAAQAGEAIFGPAGAVVFSVIVIVSVTTTLAVYLMVAPRVYYAMARDRLFFEGIAQVHPRFGTPARAIMLQALLASVMVALGTFGQVVAYLIFVTVLFVALTVAALFVLRRRQAAPGTYRTPGYPATPLVFLVLVAVLLFLLASNNPKQAALGTAVVALGWPVYWLGLRGRGSGVSGRE
ncbi:MAG TPA: amino acid permease [Gemmatimonadales bacterium]